MKQRSSADDLKYSHLDWTPEMSKHGNSQESPLLSPRPLYFAGMLHEEDGVYSTFKNKNDYFQSIEFMLEINTIFIN